MSKKRKRINLQIETKLEELTPRERLDYRLWSKTLEVLECEFEAISMYLNECAGFMSSEDVYNCKMRQASMLEIVNRIEILSFGAEMKEINDKALYLLHKMA